MMELPFGLNASELVMRAITTGSIGVFILLAGRVLRRSKAIAAYLWLFGGFLTLMGVFIAAGILDVDVSRLLELARMAGDVVRWGGRTFTATMYAGVLTPVCGSERVAGTSRTDGRVAGCSRYSARAGVRVTPREVPRTAAGERPCRCGPPRPRVSLRRVSAP